MDQVGFSFDQETLKKIGKGALISATGAGALFILNYVGSIQINDPNLASLVAFFVPFMVNVIKEWIKGEES